MNISADDKHHIAVFDPINVGITTKEVERMVKILDNKEED